MSTVTIKNDVGENLTLYVNSIDLCRKMPTVILLHGFTSKGNNSTNIILVDRLSKQGIASVCVDLSGHGASEGDIAEQTVSKAENEIKSVFNWVINQDWIDTERIAILGNSFSGSAAILFAAENKKLSALALKSPVTDYYDVRLRQLGNARMEEWKEAGRILLNDGTPSNYSFISDLNHFNIYEEIQKAKCPILVVQGDKDEDIPMEHVKKLEKCIDPSKDVLKIIHGANHGYTNKDHFQRMIDIIAEYLTNKLKNDVY